MEKIGFFGGSFDPIHFGHINLALQMYEIHKLDHILFCPAVCSPHKTSTPPAESYEKRAHLVELAIEGIPYFSLTKIQENLGDVSYHIDTLRLLLKDERYKNAKIYLILAEDSIQNFYLWKDVFTLCELATPLFGARKDYSSNLKDYPDKKLLPIIKKGLVDTKVMEISSTDLRDRLKKKLYCNHLLPAKVLDYIYKDHLYS